MSPFTYTKVSSNSSQVDPFEQQAPNHKADKLSGWRKAADSVQFLRWPVTFFLLIAVLVCELSILHEQASSLKLGGEINNLIPECKSIGVYITSPSEYNVTNPCAVSTEKKTFYTDKRYASDHKTMASINATKHQWMGLMPCKTPNFPHAQPLHASTHLTKTQAAAASSKFPTTPRTHSLPPCISPPQPANKSSPSPSSTNSTA